MEIPFNHEPLRGYIGRALLLVESFGVTMTVLMVTVGALAVGSLFVSGYILGSTDPGEAGAPGEPDRPAAPEHSLANLGAYASYAVIFTVFPMALLAAAVALLFILGHLGWWVATAG